MEAETKEFNSKIKTKNSFTNRLSYSLGGFLDNFFSAAFTVRVISYYEDEILLPIILVSLSFVIYGLWNMFNDPLIGFFTDQNTKITRRWGRRFPWYMIAVIPFAIFYLLIFTVPFYNTILIFLWLLFCICLFDFFYSLWDTSWLALFPEKFRSNKERINVAGIATICGQVGIACGMLIPPL
ncbi:MAG TPA: MFS transporter, partial [Candidatus Lokiarchaeia archaeon]